MVYEQLDRVRGNVEALRYGDEQPPTVVRRYAKAVLARLLDVPTLALGREDPGRALGELRVLLQPGAEQVDEVARERQIERTLLAALRPRDVQQRRLEVYVRPTYLADRGAAQAGEQRDAPPVAAHAATERYDPLVERGEFG